MENKFLSKLGNKGKDQGFLKFFFFDFEEIEQSRGALE